MTLREQLHEIKQQVIALRDEYKHMYEMFRKRGMRLPPTMVATLTTIEKAVTKLDTDVALIEQREQLVNLISLVSDSVPQTYQAVLDALCDIMDAEAGYLAEPSDDGWQVTYDNSTASIPRLDDHIFDRIINRFETQREVIMTDQYSYADLDLKFVTGLRSMLIIPVWVDDKPLAGFYLEQHMKHGVWSFNDQHLLKRALPILTHVLQVTQQLADN